MRILMIAGLLALGACTPTTPMPGPGPQPTEPQENACRAAEYQYLVGRDRTAIPVAPPGATWRVTCSSCPVTMDYNPSRLNIFYNQQSGTVEQVRCG